MRTKSDTQLLIDSKILIAGVWLVLTLTLTGWWLVFGLRQAAKLVALDHSSQAEHARQQRMLLWEGSILFVLVMTGGGALIYLIIRERKQAHQIREFFASFSHETKTSIASLRLQAESLMEDLKGQPSPLLNRLVSDTVRLELQLENSLFFSQNESLRLFFEDLSLAETIQSLRHQWPGINIRLPQDAMVHADRRSIESVFKNLVQNAVIHGKAQNISIHVLRSQIEDGKLEIQFVDDGKGYQGDAFRLGEAFFRHNSGSGSGLGLYIVRVLVEKMSGQIGFEKIEKGFAVKIILPGAMK